MPKIPNDTPKAFAGTITGRIPHKERLPFHEIPKYPEQADDAAKMIREIFESPSVGQKLMELDFGAIEQRAIALLISEETGVALQDVLAVMITLKNIKLERMY